MDVLEAISFYLQANNIPFPEMPVPSDCKVDLSLSPDKFICTQTFKAAKENDYISAYLFLTP